MNFVLSTGYIPPVLLEGLLTPVPKKDKDQTLPTNYRGITVLSILGKVLEKVLQDRTESLLTRNQSRLQRGFTKKSSSVNAALLISEVQNEAKDKGELVTLDAAKAFDVVWQASLLRKIYHEGVDGTLWLTLSSMYSNAVTSVKWGPHVSSSFPIGQGVRQGGFLVQHTISFSIMVFFMKSTSLVLELVSAASGVGLPRVLMMLQFWATRSITRDAWWK